MRQGKAASRREMPERGGAEDGSVFSRPVAGELRLQLAGAWTGCRRPVTADQLRQELAAAPAVRRLTFDARQLGAWDSGLLTFVLMVGKVCAERQVAVDETELPEGVRRLIALATAVPEHVGAHQKPAPVPFLEHLGDLAVGAWQQNLAMAAFIGEAAVAFGRLLTGRARFRRADLFTIMRDCGSHALPIVSLISVLVGLILAFVGAVQLSMFGAEIYVASLVGIAVVRVMGAIMTGIIMAGRTGAAFAAELGTMQVNEEIDALATMGFSPFEFLVLPRLLALSLMMPLLCLYADLMGILGGLFVGVFMLDLNVMEYVNMTQATVRLKDFWVGLFHSAVFGVLVALCGCLRGMQCGRSASAVGAATTSAVVSGIVSIVVATGVITLMCNVLGI
ncbi:MAG TPA: ABC transporter permease [Desulfuromonadales bacterium]|nr:ABC transporter permease [Desulfuromonadales bacterium]